MSKRKTGLGRGLESLIPRAAPSVEAVDVDLIVPNPHQPRASLGEESLRELAESIREYGMLQPLLVSRTQDPGGALTYQLIAGERRLQAAKMVGLEKVPVVVKEIASDQLLELALVENLQRADLNPLEEAGAYRRLHEDFGLTQEQIAARVGRSRTAVANSLRLLALSPEIRASLASSEISEGHARALLGLDDESQRRRAWHMVMERGLSVRQTEELVRSCPRRARGAQPRARMRSPELLEVEERLRASLGTRVSLTRSRRGGRIIIHFYSQEELEGLVERLTAG